MIKKLTPEQLKAVFDVSDTSDVTDADHAAARRKAGCCVVLSSIRLLKHYHPELFADPRLEAAKKLAREILAEEYEKAAEKNGAKLVKGGYYDITTPFKAITRALLMDPPTGEADDA